MTHDTYNRRRDVIDLRFQMTFDPFATLEVALGFMEVNVSRCARFA